MANQTISSLLILGVALFEAGGAEAQPINSYRVKAGVSEGIQNMREGPGVGHRVVKAIPAGAEGVEKVGDCQNSDGHSSKSVWCYVRWRYNYGWVAMSGLEPSAAARKVQQKLVVNVTPMDLARAGIAWTIYPEVNRALNSGELSNYRECPYQGEGYTFSLSPSLISNFKQRGFSLRTMCLALGSSNLKFDPESGAALARYQLPGYGNNTDYQFAIRIPDCLKRVRIIKDQHFEIKWAPSACNIKYNPEDGLEISKSSSVNLLTGGPAGEAPSEVAASARSSTSSAELGALMRSR